MYISIGIIVTFLTILLFVKNVYMTPTDGTLLEAIKELWRDSDDLESTLITTLFCMAIALLILLASLVFILIWPLILPFTLVLIFSKHKK